MKLKPMPLTILGRILEGIRMAHMQDREIVSINMSKLDEDKLLTELQSQMRVPTIKYRIHSVLGVYTCRSKVLSITLKL